MAQAPLTVRQWTRKEYDRLVELGMFEREPLELIGGQLIVAEPKGTYHSVGVGKVTDVPDAENPHVPRRLRRLNRSSAWLAPLNATTAAMTIPTK